MYARANSRVVGLRHHGRNSVHSGKTGVHFARSRLALLLSSADLDLSNLYYSAIPVRGAVTPSFTRATVKTIQNNDGYMVTILAGELGFPGARRVYNLWTTDSTVLADTANKSLTLPAGAYQFSMGAGAGTATFSGTGGATGTLAATVVGRVHVAKTITAGTLVVTASVADLVDLQVVSMVAETDQTTIREYVSVGVASSPAYHGSMVDCVKCFPTDLSGNPLTGMTTPLIELAETELCIQNNSFNDAVWIENSGTITITHNAVGPDGAISAWTFTDDAGGFEGKVQSIAATSGTAYTQHAFVGKTTGTPASYPGLLFVEAAGVSVSGAIINTTTGTAVAMTSGYGAFSTFLTPTIVVESFNSLFWRVKVTETANSTGNWYLGVVPAMNTTGTGAVLPATTGSAVFAMVGRVAGTSVGSYIATTTVAAPRDADQFLYTGALLGTLKSLAVLDFKRESGFADAGIIAALSDGTTNNYADARLSSATIMQCVGTVGGVTQWNPTASNAYTPGTLSSAAFSAATNDIKMAKDGVAQTPDTVATIPTVDRLEYGMVAGAFQLNGYPGVPYGWVRLLSQSELNAVTA